MSKQSNEVTLSKSVGFAAWLIWLMSLAFCLYVDAQAPKQIDSQLKFVVIVERHGVRSPTGSGDKLDAYSVKPWPKWNVPPGYLTTQGSKLISIIGTYDRDYFARRGLVDTNGCRDASSISIYADSDQRTIETGHAFSAGMFPGCTVEQHNLPEGSDDPLFHSLAAGIGHADHELATAAIGGRIGNDPAALTAAYRPQLETLNKVLRDCDPSTTCANQAEVKKSLLDIPSSLDSGNGDHMAELKGPLSTAATLTENFLLEYSDGLPESQVGWGHVNLGALKQLMDLHTASSDLTRRTPYLARAQASNMMSHIVQSLQQAIAQKAMPGALGKPANRILLLVGHDTNITSIAGMLNLSWLVDDRRDDTPPGGALVFELWQRPGKDDYQVHTYYTAQTLEQMRNLTPLTLATPPARANVFVPGCSMADEEYSCEWKAFQRTVEAAIDPDFVR